MKNNRLTLKICAIMSLVALAVVFGAKTAESQSTALRVIKTIRNTSVLTVQTHQYYGTDPRQILDAYIHDVPVTGGRPWVVIYHGGSWENATKDTYSAANLAQRWFNEGFNVFNAEYQPMHNADGSLYISATTGKAAAWPQMRIDTQLAVNYIKANASAFNINVNRGAAYGFSAGGHLAALNGAYYNGVKVVVSVGGVLKPDYVAVMGEKGVYSGQQATDDMRTLYGYAVALVGCPHRDWTSCGNQWATFLPNTYLSSTKPAYYVIQGADDTVVPYGTLAGFDYWLNQAGVDHRVKMVDGFGHTDAMIAPGTALWADVVAYVKAQTA